MSEKTIQITSATLSEFVRKARSQGQLRCLTKCARCGDMCDSFFIFEDQEKCFDCTKSEKGELFGKAGLNFFIVKNGIYLQVPFYCKVENQ